MQTQIDPAYLAQIQTARESVCNTGQALEAQRKALFGKRAHHLGKALEAYNAAAEEYNAILEAVEAETCGGFYEKPAEWQRSEIGQAYEEWMQAFQLGKIEPLDEKDVRAKHVHIVKEDGDANEVPDRLHIISREDNHAA